MLGLLHRLVLARGHVVKPRWACRLEAVYWLSRGDWKLARIFWRA